ncbi:MAG: sugar kinase [Microbacteriaceae bacterium]|nr:MAG: sugar kinase [Microbacteriaceae bacterium]
MKVLGYGDNVIDRFIDRRIDYPGGNCVNFAVFASQLSVPAGYLGTFGSDEHGEFIRTELVGLGIDVSRSVIRDGESGMAEVEVVGGERMFRGGNHGGVTVREPVVLGEDELDYVAEFDLIHSSVYSSAENEIPKLAGMDVLVSYDFSGEAGYRSSPYLERIAPFVDLALFSCSELSEAQTESLLHGVVERGAGMVLCTRGEEGAVLYDGRQLYRTPASPLDQQREVADTMGCGDAFLAAFVVSLLTSGWRKRSPAVADAIPVALAAGAAHSAAQCYIHGAFGHGRPYSVAQQKHGIAAVRR